jgi:hypothetical protein
MLDGSRAISSSLGVGLRYSRIHPYDTVVEFAKMKIEEINQMNAEFWAAQKALLRKRMADEAIRETAFEAMATETVKGLPLFYQKSIYEALADADRARKRFMSQHARRGGLAGKTDVLQELIEHPAEPGHNGASVGGPVE